MNIPLPCRFGDYAECHNRKLPFIGVSWFEWEKGMEYTYFFQTSNEWQPVDFYTTFKKVQPYEFSISDNLLTDGSIKDKGYPLKGKGYVNGIRYESGKMYAEFIITSNYFEHIKVQCNNEGIYLPEGDIIFPIGWDEEKKSRAVFKSKKFMQKGDTNMGKFKLDKITGVGEGLLNAQSKNVEVQKRTEYIPISKIHPNPRNGLSLNNIPELASQIKAAGLEQPLVVYQMDDGDYMLLTGHRRFKAINYLIESGDWDADKPVECKVKDLDAMDLPLDFEDKEMLSILTTNQNRKYEHEDIAFEIREWKNLIAKLRAKGVTIMVVGNDENGNDITRNIAGVKTRDLVAEQLGISSAQVAKYDKVENRGSDELKAALKENRINVSNAAQVANMQKPVQAKFITEILEKKGTDEQITSDDIAVEEKKQSSKKKNEREEKAIYVISTNVFNKDMRDISKLIDEGGKHLTDSQYAAYCRYIKGLKKLFS